MWSFIFGFLAGYFAAALTAIAVSIYRDKRYAEEWDASPRVPQQRLPFDPNDTHTKMRWWE